MTSEEQAQQDEAFDLGVRTERERCVRICENMANQAMREGDEASHRNPNGGTKYYIRESALRDVSNRIRQG